MPFLLWHFAAMNTPLSGKFEQLSILCTQRDLNKRQADEKINTGKRLGTVDEPEDYKQWGLNSVFRSTMPASELISSIGKI